MIHSFYILIGCLLIILTRRVYYRNFELFLCLLIPVNFEFFHLVPRLGEFDQYQESLLVVVLFYFVEEFFVKDTLKKNTHQKQFSMGIYGKILICYLFLLFWGIWVAYFRGQDLILGIKAFKFYPLVLVYFLIVKKGVNIEKFTQYFIWLSVGIAILASIQYVTFSKLSLFYFYDDSITHIRDIDSVRGLRILEGNTVITIGVVIAYMKWLKTHQKKYLLITLSLILHIFIVIKTRMVLVAVVFTMIGTSFLYNKSQLERLTKMLYFIVMAIFIIIWLVPLNPSIIENQGMIKQTISDLQGLASDQGTGNLNIRFLCYQHYWQELQSYRLTGRGLFNINWTGNPDKYWQESYGYYLTDIGVFHLIVTLGLSGGMFLCFIIFNVIRKMTKLMSTAPEIACYFFIGIVMLPQIDLFFRLDHIFIFSIFTAIYSLSLEEHTYVEKNSFYHTRP